MASELRVLEQRLSSLALGGSEGDGAAAPVPDANGPAGPYALSGSLMQQLERLAASGGGGGSAAKKAAAVGGADGHHITYEINYAPSTTAMADGAKVAALES